METIVIDNYTSPFGIIPSLRLQLVPRWGIISMSRPQSVAEHSFNVALITGHIAFNLGYKNSDIDTMVHKAVHHDYKEVYTSDIPSPAKLNSSHTDPLVKLADCLESYRFAKQYCNDTTEVKEWLLKGLYNSIQKYAKESGVSYDIYGPLIEEIK